MSLDKTLATEVYHLNTQSPIYGVVQTAYSLDSGNIELYNPVTERRLPLVITDDGPIKCLSTVSRSEPYQHEPECWVLRKADGSDTWPLLTLLNFKLKDKLEKAMETMRTNHITSPHLTPTESIKIDNLTISYGKATVHDDFYTFVKVAGDFIGSDGIGSLIALLDADVLDDERWTSANVLKSLTGLLKAGVFLMSSIRPGQLPHFKAEIAFIIKKYLETLND